ncbi:hypothetical protein D3C86_1891760 [compost metagenome]
MRQYATARALIGQQRLQPASEGIGAAGQAAGGGKVQTGAGQLPALFGTPVTGGKPRHHVIPAFRCPQLHLQRLGNVLLNQLVEVIAFGL